MKKLFFFRLLLFPIISYGFSGPNFSGSWTGYITQNSSIALATNYHFNLYLQVDGDGVSGRSEIRMWDERDIFAEMSLEGHTFEYSLQLTETGIIREKIYSYAYWCIKSMHLTYNLEDGKETLRGNWASDLCSGPGEVYLEREPML